MALEWQKWEARTGLPQQGFVSFPLLNFFSVTLLCFIQHAIPGSWKLLILTIPHPHKCRCTIHTDTKSMYVFSCRRNMVFMLCKMNKEKRKPRILGYCPNHTALKSVVRWKKPHTTKKPLRFLPRKVSKFSNLFTTDVYPQETEFRAGGDWTGIQHQKPLLPELGNNIWSVCTWRQTWCCRTFPPNCSICF